MPTPPPASGARTGRTTGGSIASSSSRGRSVGPGTKAVTVSTTDDLALISSEVDPALRLTVSKRLGRRFEIVLSDNLDDDELTWVVIYRPRPGFELRAISRDNTEYTGEFRQEILFGPGVPAARIVAPARVARDRVAQVTVSGQPGFPDADVLAA